MNIPADIPSPDQENVYYSIKALVAEFSKYFEASSIKIIKPLLEEFYYPSFVFDDSNAPTSYQLDVYPREGQKHSMLLSETGSIITKKGNKDQPVTAPVEENLKDKGSKVKLDSTFYSNAKLKSSDFFTDLDEDLSTNVGVDLLLGTKFWYNSQFASQRLQFLDISKNIVSSTLKNMPEPELQALKDEFSSVLQQIDSTVTVLSDIKQGQSLSLDALKYENIVQSSYKSSTVVQNSYTGLKGTKVNVAQSIVDLARSNPGGGSSQIRKGSIKTNGVFEEKISITGNSSVGNPFQQFQKLWNTLLHRLKEKGHISRSSLELAVANINNPHRISELPPDILDVLQFSHQGSDPKDVFSEEGWLKTWYYDNFSKKIIGEETDFSGLDAFADKFGTLSEEATALSDQILLGGGYLLVTQAIMKSILRLCQSGIDVTEYAPMSGTETIFAKMGRSAALGPSGCHQTPSMSVHDVEEYKIDPFTKTGFLNYHSIICILRSIFDNNNSVKNWIKGNMTEFDSDHDMAIKLWDSISDYGKKSNQSHAKQPPGSSKTYTSRNAFLKQPLHLYTINEEFQMSDIYLVGAGDDRVSRDKRTFVQWCIPPIDHHLESTYILIGEPSDPEVKPLHKDNDAAVSSDGDIVPSETSKAYKLMGFMGSAEELSSTYTVAGHNFFKRTKRVHYGWKNSSWDSDEKNNNTWDFWKQKNWNMPYFWAATVSLCKAIVVETGRNLLDSVKEITGTDFELSQDEIMEILPMNELWVAIERTQEKLRNMNALYLQSFVGPDGNISFCESKDSPLGTRIWSIDYRNTSGGRTRDMIRNYIKFVAMCSEKNSIQVVEDNEPVIFDYATYIPPEALAKDSNQNFKNNHGGFENYISTDFDVYYDTLNFRKIEFIDGVPINKNTTPLGIENEFLSMYQSYIGVSSTLWGHVNMHSKILEALQQFKTFVGGFKINDDAKSIFTDGHFDPSTDIQNPEVLVEQIRNNSSIYEPTALGIRRDWGSIDLDAVEQIKDDILYVYVLGLKKSLWNDTSVPIKIVPEYYGSEEGIEVEDSACSFEYYIPINPVSTGPTIHGELTRYSEIISKDIIDYLHVVRGISCNELTFSEKQGTIYSDLVINSESDSFPWTSDDFKEGIPKKEVDTLFNISPWVFPRNYFYDVCLENEYQRVVGIPLRRSQLASTPIDTLDAETSLDDIIGSIRWIVKGE